MAAELIQDEKIHIDKLITKIFKMENAEEAYQYKSNMTAVKIIITNI